MKQNKQNSLLWSFFLLSISLGIVWQFFPLNDAQERLKNLPLIGLKFSGENIPLSEGEKSTFKKINILKRSYIVGNTKYFISVLDGTNDRHMVHDPVYCFSGGGWTLIKKSKITIKNGYLNHILLKKENEEKEGLIWFSNNKRSYTSFIEYFANTCLRRLTLGFSGEESVLILVQPLNRNRRMTLLEWEEFIQAFPELIKL